MASKPEDRTVLAEHEHQALDTLEAVPLGDVWQASHGGAAESPFDVAAALREAGEDLAEIEDAIATARPMFARLIAAMAEPLLIAAEVLAATEDRGALDPEAIGRVRQTLNESPELAPALAGAVETVAMVLGLDRQALAWALLVELGEQANAQAPELVRECSTAIGERLAAAWPASRQHAGAAEPARALRVFRSAVVAAAGPDVRARSLAADHPEHLPLARTLVESESDPAVLVDRFDAARAALVAAEPKRPDNPEDRIDGPKRKFTIVHLILALIIAGLTVWHYVFR
jgi:hypothetical protein